MVVFLLSLIANTFRNMHVIGRGGFGIAERAR